MITILAEKFDVGIKIAAALSGFTFEGTTITMDNIEKHKPKIEKQIKPKGYITIKYQGKDYAVTWASGHLLGLKQAKDYNPEYASWSKIPFPYFPNYEIKINDKIDFQTRKSLGIPDPWIERQLKIIDQLFNQSEYIISATDDDREGELIFAYIYEYLNCTVPYKRIKLDSQTTEGFRNAFANLIDSSQTKGVEKAGRLRGIYDWSCGANLSGMMTLKYQKYVPEIKMITVGRVQTYVLNLIVEREMAIRNFKSHPFWYIIAEFVNADGDKYSAKHSLKQIEDKAKAEEIFNKVLGKNGTVTSYEKTDVKKEVPLLYNISSLSRVANEKFGISSNDCLKICQGLYEKGFITYPRTDSQHLTSDMKPTVDEVLNMLVNYSEEYKKWIEAVDVNNRNYTKRHFDTSKVESHFAIIPTNVKPTGLTGMDANIYDLIAKSLIRIIYKNAVSEKTTIITNVEGEEFRSTGTVVVDPQWMIVDAMPSEAELLPKLNIGDIVSGDYELKEGKTEPPKRYTDATLTAALETASKTIDDDELKAMLETCNKGGIGRPSTRGPIINNVVSKYCTLKGKQIVPTDVGIKIVELLPIDDLKSAEMTAQWETKLDEVQKNQLSYDDFMKEMEENIKRWCQLIKDDTREFEIPVQADTSTTDIMCPKCKSHHMRKLSWGWACSGYSKDNPSGCNFALGYEMSGAKLSDKDIETLINNKKSKFIDGFKSKDGKTYGCYLTLDEEGNLGRTWDTGYKCPKCSKPVLGGSGPWNCEGKKTGDCDFILWAEFSHKKLTTAEKEQLLTEGRTKAPVKNLVKNNGEKYDSVLVMVDGKVGFPPKEK